MGAGIETPNLYRDGLVIDVAPHVGAWIETISQSLMETDHTVAPHVGAWIEAVSKVHFEPFRI